MKPISVLLITMLLFVAINVEAQKNRSIRNIPAIPSLNSRMNASLVRKISNTLLNTGIKPTANLKNTSGSERLLADVVYDLRMPAGPQLNDSLRISYSGNRTSTFDFDQMTFDIDNTVDFPYSFMSGGGFSFDSVRKYDPPTFTNYSVTGYRTYNSNGKVILNANLNERNYFVYDVQNRVIRTTTLDSNSITWDSTSQDFYFYNSAGFLIQDSSEDRNGSGWDPGINEMITNNASGNPVLIQYQVPLGGGVSLNLAQETITYNGTGLRNRSILEFINNTSTGLEKVYKDTIGYSGTMKVYENTYSWDTSMQAWRLASSERRHLNGAALPDSVWSIYLMNATPNTQISKWAFNSQGDPVTQEIYSGSNMTPDNEELYYYGPVNVGVTGVNGIMPLSMFPNPASQELHVSGNLSGHFRITNMIGQVCNEGNLSNSGEIQINLLQSGLYYITISGSNGKHYQGTFVKE